jgi:cardiolipin synthase
VPAAQETSHFRCFGSGDDIFVAMLAAINSAQLSVRLEVYTYAGDRLGEQFREALVQAQGRGVKVSVLFDAFGSLTLGSGFWEPLAAAGGAARWFNPLLKRFGFRDHRKILICDDRTAFIGGFNLSTAYEGDGIRSGWRDFGLQVTGPLATPLALVFDEMFARADFEHKPFTLFRRSTAKQTIRTLEGRYLFTGPGRGRNPIEQNLLRDLSRAKQVQIVSAYFLPTQRIRRELTRVVRRGGRVRIVLAGKSDVYLSQLAARSLYRRLLRAGIEIYEYQPQILHGKLIWIDHTVYIGSANLDLRSLRINYELALRLTHQQLVDDARRYFDECLAHSVQINFKTWCRSHSWWSGLKQRWAYFVIARLDPYLARWQYQRRSR